MLEDVRTPRRPAGREATMSAEPTPDTIAAVGRADRAIAAMVAALAEVDPELTGAYDYTVELHKTDGSFEPLRYWSGSPRD
jgi:hypothetical protein